MAEDEGIILNPVSHRILVKGFKISVSILKSDLTSREGSPNILCCEYGQGILHGKIRVLSLS
jgi:hypothetical protein